MLHQDNYGRLLLAQEHADRLAQDYGRLGLRDARRRASDLARLLSRRRRRRLLRQRAYST
jgi:hypothetical protein